MTQPIFITEQDGSTPMLLKELTVARHLRATPSCYNRKMLEKTDYS